jgi:signal transduction histidine kinase
VQRSEKMNLTASARLIMQLGEQLIEDELVALLELIKNAYDADANNVDVVIDTDTITPYGVGRIEIKDDGNGMIPSIVRNSFLRLSTSFKEEEKSSIYYHRRVLGKKGIGRLSFQRLGNYITVETVPNIERFEETDLLKDEDVEFIKEYRKINIDIDWSEFPIDMDFSDIIATVKYEKDVVASSGTKIVIQGIKNLNFWDMDKKKEEKLKNELLNMMDPFQKNLNLKKSERFNVLLKINDVPYSAEPIDESLLDELYDSKVSFDFKDWKLHVKIERPLKYVMQRRNSIVNRMEDSGYEILRETQYEKECEDYLVNFKDLNKVYIDYPKIKFTIEKTTFLSESLISKLVEKKEKGEITEEEYRKAIVDQYAYPGDFAGVIYARDKKNKEEIDIILGKEGLVKAKLNTLSDINKAWSSMQGVYVYRNGFRVLPYGRKDWIGFTEKSQTAANNIYKEHTVVGYLKLDGFTSEKLEEQTNRQGFIQDEYGKNFFMLIQNFLLNIMFESDIKFRDGFSRIKEKKDGVVTDNGKIIFERIADFEDEKNARMQDVKEQVEDLRIAISNKAMAANMPQKVVENLQDTILQYEAVEKKAIDEKKQEIYLKSQQIEEIKDIVPLLGLGIIAESLTHEMNRIEQNIEDCARDTIKCKTDTDKIVKNQRNIITQTNFLKIQLAHMESTYRRNLEKQEEILLRDFLLDMYVNEDSPMSRKARRDGVDVLVEGANILIKANKGILTTIFDNIFLNSLYWVQYSQQKKYIKFIVKQSGTIECFDSGCGVHPEIEDKLFEPFRFMKENGRGLGLFIVRELTENMNGRVWLSDERRDGRRFKFVFDLSERMA